MFQKFKETVLAIPWVYSLVQWLFGTTAGQRRLLRYMDVRDGQTVLDVGCGTAIILDYLPDVLYHGFDMNGDYLAVARRKYADRRAEFHQEYVSEATLPAQLAGKCDLVLAIGLLHHLPDEQARTVLEMAHAALGEGGRLVTVDPVFIDGQNPVSRFLVGADRGRHVRHERDVEGLFKAHFKGKFELHRENLTNLPYNNLVAVGFK